MSRLQVMRGIFDREGAEAALKWGEANGLAKITCGMYIRKFSNGKVSVSSKTNKASTAWKRVKVNWMPDKLAYLKVRGQQVSLLFLEWLGIDQHIPNEQWEEWSEPKPVVRKRLKGRRRLKD